MNTYTVTFQPLASAKAKWIEDFTAEIETASKAEALKQAGIILNSRGFKRSDFRKKPMIQLKGQPSNPVKDNTPNDWDSLEIESTQPEWTVKSLNERLAQLRPGERFFIDNLSDELYHQCDGLSCSQLKVFLECPQKFWAKYIAQLTRQSEKAYFDFGKAAHAAVLEPWRLQSDFIQQPDDIKVRRGEKWEKCKAAATKAGQIVLTKDQYEDVGLLRESVTKLPAINTLCTDGVVERSIFTRDKETGLLIKVRPDYLKGKVITDIKTTNDGKPHRFAASAKRLGYHIQDAMYSDVAGADLFIFVAIESERPFVVTAPIIMSEDMKRLGYLLYRKALRDVKACMESGEWPAYTVQDVEIEAARWDLEQLEELEFEQLAKEDAA